MPLSAGAREARAPWLRLLLTPGIGPAAVRRLLEAFGLPEDVLAAGHAKLSAVLDPVRARALLSPDDKLESALQAALEWAEAPEHHLLALDDPRYPSRLLEIADPPPLLFLLGNPDVLQRPALAVVGSRHATQAGLGHARDFSRALGHAGLTIVSGLAQGIDAAAHQGALDTAAGTVAVVGTGLDIVYPAGHRALAEQIATNGAVVSELPLGTPAQRSNFPRRNRLIAGLSLATLVVEAARQSGALITARQATEAGREVMAIPGSIHSPLSKGCHRLIREGAKLVESADDVLVELHGQFRAGGSGAARGTPAVAAPVAGDTASSEAGRTLLEALGFDPVDVDTLVDRTRRPAGELGALLLRLELEGRVERLVDGRFTRL
jgi:DNA processing protein